LSNDFTYFLLNILSVKKRRFAAYRQGNPHYHFIFPEKSERGRGFSDRKHNAVIDSAVCRDGYRAAQRDAQVHRRKDASRARLFAFYAILKAAQPAHPAQPPRFVFRADKHNRLSRV
jgi:hypothetical protein